MARPSRCIPMLVACTMAGLISPHPAAANQPSPPSLWDDQPAEDWEKEAYPIGNGRMGGMIFGGIDRERIQFNEDTLWVGDESDTGAYQNFGEILVDIDGSGETSGYRRSLDIRNGVHEIVYQRNGVAFRRTAFASYPDGVLVVRFEADKPGALSGRVSLVDAHDAKPEAKGDTIVAAGNLKGTVFTRNGKKQPYAFHLDYEAQLKAIPEGGTVAADGEGLRFEGCNSLTLVLAAGTDYVNRRDQGWRGDHPHKRLTAALEKAASTPYAELLDRHRRDFSALSDRCSLDLGKSGEAARDLPTRRRVEAYRKSRDPELEALLFQYARYLMISSSRPGTLPANLQGVWNNSNNPPWRCDYHTDVNLQMNYWFVDAANLPGCFSPVAEWLRSHIPVRREATKRDQGIRGFSLYWENGIFGGSSAKRAPGDAAWLMQNIWDHYDFTRDRDYLENMAYPMMKELCEFWEDSLIERPGGELVAPKSKSPEHGPEAEGNSYDQQLIHNLFTNYIEASEALDKDPEFRARVKSMRDRLLKPRIGKWGQLQEWAEDIDDPKDKHRHLSHLIAVHPGRQISPKRTPELADAAAVSMNARGDGGTGWSKSWKINIWARLRDGDRAHKLLSEAVKGNFHGNLFGFHPPFQIDGNFGYASGVCEMLLQSHLGEIELLPALPAQWPEGSVKGLVARGDYTVDMHWKDGLLEQATIHAGQNSPGSTTVAFRGKSKNIDLRPGESTDLSNDDFE